jgi:hypothetical protein
MSASSGMFTIHANGFAMLTGVVLMSSLFTPVIATLWLAYRIWTWFS